MNRIFSPWSSDEVKKLKERQKNNQLHPYTCDCGEILVPTEFGLICPNSYCDYMQNWVHEGDLL